MDLVLLTVIFGPLLAVPLALCLSAFVWRLRRRAVWCAQGRCSSCGYDLRGTTRQGCPECGEAVAIEGLRHDSTTLASITIGFQVGAPVALFTPFAGAIVAHHPIFTGGGPGDFMFIGGLFFGIIYMPLVAILVALTIAPVAAFIIRRDEAAAARSDSRR